MILLRIKSAINGAGQKEIGAKPRKAIHPERKDKTMII
jgi:hypothetical protein